MKKSTWKEVDKLAQKLLINWLPTGRETHAWARAGAWDRDNWRRLAKYILTEPVLLPKRPAPKSCRLVDGKVVCS